jgi:hypothetical protein
LIHGLAAKQMSLRRLANVNISQMLDEYAVSPSKQLNLGYTVTKFWILGLILVGLLALVVVHLLFLLNPDYKNNNTSKVAPTWVAIVGATFVIVGLVSTWTNFYNVVDRINDISAASNDALFTSIEEGAKAAVEQGLTAAANKANYTKAVEIAANVSEPLKAPRPIDLSEILSVDVPRDNPFLLGN